MRINHPSFATTGANVPALVDRLWFRPCIQAHGAGGSGPFSWVDGFHLGLLSTIFLECLHQWLKDNLFCRIQCCFGLEPARSSACLAQTGGLAVGWQAGRSRLDACMACWCMKGVLFGARLGSGPRTSHSSTQQPFKPPRA